MTTTLTQYGFTTDDNQTFNLEHIADNSAVLFRITLTADDLARVDLIDDSDGATIFTNTLHADDLADLLTLHTPDHLAKMLKYFAESSAFFSNFA